MFRNSRRPHCRTGNNRWGKSDCFRLDLSCIFRRRSPWRNRRDRIGKSPLGHKLHCRSHRDSHWSRNSSPHHSHSSHHRTRASNQSDRCSSSHLRYSCHHHTPRHSRWDKRSSFRHRYSCHHHTRGRSRWSNCSKSRQHHRRSFRRHNQPGKTRDFRRNRNSRCRSAQSNQSDR